MDEVLRKAELLKGLTDDEFKRIATIGRTRELSVGEYLFLLGDDADRLFVVLDGQVDLCFPISIHGVMNDITVESVTVGKTLGWSSLVKPYRLTLSARGSEPSRLIGFMRQDLLQLFHDEPRIALVVLTELSRIVGVRLLRMQALWARELQRTLSKQTERIQEE